MLIVFEGADGTGKTTAAKWLAETLREHMPDTMTVLYAREPTTGPFGTAIRQATSLDPVVETALFVADRVRHVQEIIKPLTLKPQSYLILDRYFYSTVAYQGARKHQGLNWAELASDAQTFCPKPDILLLFECDVDVAMQRVSGRGEIDSKLEVADYQRDVQRIFRQVVPSHTVVIDTTEMSIEDVQEAVVDGLSERSATLRLLLEKNTKNA